MPWNYDARIDEEWGCVFGWSMKCIDMIDDPIIIKKAKIMKAYEAAHPEKK